MVMLLSWQRPNLLVWIALAAALEKVVLPPLSVGEMMLRHYGAFNYSQNSARDLRCALNGA